MKVFTKRINHLILRAVCLPAGIVLLLLMKQLATGKEQFISFLHNWKLLTFFSFGAIMVHTTLELKIAVEDYVPHIAKRKTAIKVLFCLLFAVLLITGLAIERL